MRTACPPGRPHRIPERFSLCVTSVLFAASTTPEPMARLPVAEVTVAHALTVLAEEGEFALDGVVPACCLVAEVAQRPDHLDDALGVMAQDMAVCLEPVGIDSMVRCRAEVLTGMPEIDGLSLGGEALEEGPVVWRSVGDGSDGDIGAYLADIRNLACELRLQRELAALRHTGEVEGLQPFTFPRRWKADRAAGGLTPAGFVTSVLTGAQRHHDTIKRDRSADRLGRDVLPVPDRVHRLWPQALPALMQAAGEPLQGACRWRHGAHLGEERLRFPCCAVTHHHQSEQPDG